MLWKCTFMYFLIEHGFIKYNSECWERHSHVHNPSTSTLVLVLIHLPDSLSIFLALFRASLHLLVLISISQVLGILQLYTFWSNFPHMKDEVVITSIHCWKGNLIISTLNNLKGRRIKHYMMWITFKSNDLTLH